jgi:hypothetical protein
MNFTRARDCGPPRDGAKIIFNLFADKSSVEASRSGCFVCLARNARDSSATYTAIGALIDGCGS